MDGHKLLVTRASRVLQFRVRFRERQLVTEITLEDGSCTPEKLCERVGAALDSPRLTEQGVASTHSGLICDDRQVTEMILQLLGTSGLGARGGPYR